MENRNYEYLKFKRTYTGGSKAKELEIFDRVQNTNDCCDWIEYRRILFPYLEDMLHVNFSRSFIAKKLSFLFLGLSFLLGFFHVAILSIIVLLLAIIFRISLFSFERKIRETQLSYNMSIGIVKNEIKIMTGLDI
jgi:hypothetical protein